MMNKGVILDLCGGSGAWSRPYKEAGYTVILVDIEEGNDVRLMKRMDERVYGILCTPPCTHLALAGAVVAYMFDFLWDYWCPPGCLKSTSWFDWDAGRVKLEVLGFRKNYRGYYRRLGRI